MKVIVAQNETELFRLAADLVEAEVRADPACCLGLATGSSPVGMYKELARRCREEGLDFSKVSSVNLDEYAGLPGEHDQSYRYFMNNELFDHINIDKANTYVAKGVGDIEENLREFRAVIASKTRAIQVLGIGPDGHIAFNEPGEQLYYHAHRETLDESTIDANARFFASRDEVPRTALTMGIGEIMRAKKLVTIISGSNKAEAARKLLVEDVITPRCPVTLVKAHPDSTVIITKELADKIGYKG